MHHSKMEIVISGISGRFPQSSNMKEFADNLLNGVDLITQSRWTPGLYGLPPRNGILNDLSKFDYEFFKFSKNEVNQMDPMLRILMEVSFEAIFDAGINPSTLRGSRTGVFVGAAKSEAGEIPTSDPDNITENTLFGYSRGMFANGISHAFNFHGPSLTVETACSSSLLALERGISAIRLGQCDSAIICGSNLLLKPQASLEFHRLNMLSLEGKCKAFDASGNGYVRSEAVVAILIQRKSSAKNDTCYGEIIHAKSNVDGHKEEGITYPSGKMQKLLLEEVYTEAGIKPNLVTYVEAHGTGTRVGDPQEVNSIADFFCENREFPLLIGSVKSNMGHAEHASGLCSLAKILVASTNKIIPGNLHYANPNLEIPGLTDGRLKVVDKNLDWDGGIVGINSFGFGGANVHVILNIPKRKSNITKTNIGPNPMLVHLSGNDETQLKCSLASINTIDSSELDLINSIARKNISGHNFRGIGVFSENKAEIIVEKIQQNDDKQSRPLWFVFSGMGSQWSGMGKDLMNLTPFKKSIDECASILKSVDVDLYEILLSPDESILKKSTTNSFVGIAAIQIGMIDTLKSIGIIPDGFLGHSVGENVCAYADGISSKEETLLIPFFAGMIFQKSDLPLGGMAAVGLGWEETKSLCPGDIFPACHNAADSVSVAGPKESIKKFVENLKHQGIFVREIDAGQAFHSSHISSTKDQLIQILKNNGILIKRKKRSIRWISTSVPESSVQNDMVISPEYFANNLISPVLFHDALKFIPQNAIVIEIGPHSLLQSILKRTLPSTCTLIGLSNKTSPNNAVTFMTGIGKLYLNGHHPIISNLYEAKRNGTDSSRTVFLSPLVVWNHSENFNVPDFEKTERNAGASKFLELSPDNFGWKINGTYFISPMFLINMVLKTYCQDQSGPKDLNLQFENIIFHKHLEKKEDYNYKISIRFLQGNGKFQVTEHGDKEPIRLVLTGQITQLEQEKPSKNINQKLNPVSAEAIHSIRLETSNIYQELNILGYSFEDQCKVIKTVEIAGNNASLTLKSYLDFDADNSKLEALFQLYILHQPRFGTPMIVSRIGKMILNSGKILDSTDFKISTSYMKNQNALESSFCKIEHISLSKLPETNTNNSEKFMNISNLRVNQAYAKVTSTNPDQIEWIEGPTNLKNFKPQDNINLELCNASCTGLNSGSSLTTQTIGIGNEFSGFTSLGQKRVMGLVQDYGLANTCLWTQISYGKSQKIGQWKRAAVCRSHIQLLIML